MQLTTETTWRDVKNSNTKISVILWITTCSCVADCFGNESAITFHHLGPKRRNFLNNSSKISSYCDVASIISPLGQIWAGTFLTNRGKNCKNGKKIRTRRKVRYTRHIHLPSWQYCLLLHSLKAALGPAQSFPPFSGFGFVQSLFLVCMPLLFLLHRLHMLQAVHPPWTCKWRKKTIKLLF